MMAGQGTRVGENGVMVMLAGALSVQGARVWLAAEKRVAPCVRLATGLRCTGIRQGLLLWLAIPIAIPG